eukprot:CAMPEP_0197622254 /NCGR_PEP_ID=MMETSP1338-20131121/2619_1 /TAXON_ID=43686 ORGANISM="Pelagodinium beii, Strain RCC1491" /NCGR_SAMPLE_ID=MMETSP1338 /ASSEMBLY_ACC=CAM_ASM_000754 /LENGTH=435 /DNA_ID=CAMNT_0043191953 /DNA_START=102 /DNA_END=1409 /DNA_ORIENTATION=-
MTEAPDSDEENKPVVKENKDHQILDTLDAEGNCIGTRTRGEVTDKGFWHRYVHVWVLNLPDSAVLMQLRAPEKKRFGGMWNCTSGFVMSGMPSLEACKKHLYSESGLKFEDHMYEFAFSCKESSVFKGEELKQWIDVYVVSLKYPPELHKIFYDIKEAQRLEYIGLGELEQAYADKDENFVLVSAPNYSRRLFQYLHKKIRTYLELIPKVDSDEERQSKKGEQLLDQIGDLDALARPAELNVVSDPCKRNDAYNQSIWHRAVHVWVFDIEGGNILIQQRSDKKRHFGGRWNCSTGHIKMGEHALTTAMKSVKDDVGLKAFKENDFEYLFQANVAMDTGGGCVLRQVVDVYMLTVPNEDSYTEVPTLKSMTLAKGEVESVKYIDIEKLEEIWYGSQSAHPDFVIPTNDEYKQRFWYYIKRRYKKYHDQVLSPSTSP